MWLKMIFKKTKSKNLKFFIVGIMAVIMFSSFVSAFGVGFQNTRLSLNPGQTIDSAFSLQNHKDGEGDLIIEVILEEGGEYLTFTEGTQFNVPTKTSVPAPVRISVPVDAKIGEVYTLKVLFRSVSGGVEEVDGEGTSIGLLLSQRRNIEIEVVPEEIVEPELPAPEEGLGTIWWVLGIVVVIIVIVVIYFLVKGKGDNSVNMPVKGGKVVQR